MTKNRFRFPPALLFAAIVTPSGVVLAQDTDPSPMFDPTPMQEMTTEGFQPVRPAGDAQAVPGTEAPTPSGNRQPLTADAINQAVYDDGPLPEGQSALTAHIQILLDRGGVSPGVIDGYAGENVDKAIRAFEAINGLEVDGVMDAMVWQALRAHADLPVKSYQITPEDLSDISAQLPDDYAKLAELEWLGYTSVAEKLAEKFHMDVEFLKQLNPGADFESAGAAIMAADPGMDAETGVARLVADKSLSRLLAYDDTDRLVLSYPVTIGSDDTPSPDGEHTILGVASDPTYSYRPDENFKQGDNDTQLILPPGPNGPVGSTWIDLSEPTYGIHGTPEPAKIGKTGSHGCVRMTNWDAAELAKLVSNGIPVSFVE